MAWTYSGDPKTSKRDEVRFLLGDTDEKSPILSDEEIDFLLEQNGDKALRAAIAGCNRIIAKYAQLVDYTIGPESVKNSQKLLNWRRLLATLKADLSSNAAPIWTGSTDASLVPVFDIGMNDNKTRGSTGLDG